MDTTAKEITFDEQGRCNFCTHAIGELAKLDQSFTWYGGKDYDCLIGLSGGVDSSYALVMAVKMGMRPLCFSVDTGYNKPEADENIMNLVEGLKVPFIRYAINQERFRELQMAFLRSGVKNVEIPTDHVLMAVSFELAAKYHIKTILSGGNVATESIMPPSWGYSARDLKHIRAIYRKFTGKRLRGLPTCNLFQWNWYRWIEEIKVVYLLDHTDYDRSLAEKLLIRFHKFKSTGEKHEENYFTWWFQNWYLFEKWGIDKRKAHYSSMIVSGSMTRQEAMLKLQENPVYPTLGLEARVSKYPKHEHEEYPMDQWYARIARFINYLQTLCKS